MHSGLPLLEFILRNATKISEKDISTIFRSIFEAVQYALEKGLSHLDLRQDNILVEENDFRNDAFRVKILNYGQSPSMSLKDVVKRRGFLHL